MNEKTGTSLIPKPVKSQLVNQVEHDGDRAIGGKDMDEESTAQNLLNIARQGDLSPRQIEKGKSTGKGRKKQQKESNNIQPAGVQTRGTTSKSNLLP